MKSRLCNVIYTEGSVGTEAEAACRSRVCKIIIHHILLLSFLLISIQKLFKTVSVECKPQH